MENEKDNRSNIMIPEDKITGGGGGTDGSFTSRKRHRDEEDTKNNDPVVVVTSLPSIIASGNNVESSVLTPTTAIINPTPSASPVSLQDRLQQSQQQTPQDNKQSLQEQQLQSHHLPPPYGSQEYWEERYKHLFKKICSQSSDQQQNQSQSNENPDPFYAWYFNFDELAPLILPLILGDGNNNNNIDDDSMGDFEEEEEEDGNGDRRESGNKTDKDDGNDAKPTEEEVGDDDDDEIEVEEKDEVPLNREGLAQYGPISVIEVGCGDVPLGRDLINAIQELESNVGVVDATHIIEKVVCLDYSKNVIGAMQKEQTIQNNNTNQSKRTTIPLIYQVADARELPYEDESFELLLEKGTLDAMLSDRDGNGSDNCRKIVAECGRVTKSSGGCMIIISHLNAHVDTGLQWLNDIIVPGLREGSSGQFEWNIEVHGNEADIPSENENGDCNDESCLESPGPAVYIIRKGELLQGMKDKTNNPETPPTIPLRFFTY